VAFEALPVGVGAKHGHGATLGPSVVIPDPVGQLAVLPLPASPADSLGGGVSVVGGPGDSTISALNSGVNERRVRGRFLASCLSPESAGARRGWRIVQVPDLEADLL
jgi:hypothetical protein